MFSQLEWILVPSYRLDGDKVIYVKNALVYLL